MFALAPKSDFQLEKYWHSQNRGVPMTRFVAYVYLCLCKTIHKSIHTHLPSRCRRGGQWWQWRHRRPSLPRTPYNRNFPPCLSLTRFSFLPLSRSETLSTVATEGLSWESLSLFPQSLCAENQNVHQEYHYMLVLSSIASKLLLLFLFSIITEKWRTRCPVHRVQANRKVGRPRKQNRK